MNCEQISPENKSVLGKNSLTVEPFRMTLAKHELNDCYFNLARGFLWGRKIHISEMSGPPEPGSPIAVADHCYTCTAGVGLTLGGTIKI